MVLIRAEWRNLLSLAPSNWALALKQKNNNNVVNADKVFVIILLLISCRRAAL